MTLAAVTLDDKYAARTGRIYLTGVQALVRLPMLQRRRDEAAGLDTATYISGYRGSPLGAYDRELWNAAGHLSRHHVHFQPGVNEELAATAVWGSQQAGLVGRARRDGVVGLWYGKGPGVDRSGDAFKHANLAGTARHGGVLVLAGDDHACRSSTVPHQSEQALIAAMIPILNPAGVGEVLDYGLLGIALSRFSGCWIALKCLAETVESAASIPIDPARPQIALPADVEMPPGGLNIRWPDSAVEQERRLHRFKIPAVLAFARANRLDRPVIDGPRRRLGIVTTGKAYLDVRQALDDLGIAPADAARIGLSVYKVGLAWPLEPEGARGFAEGLEEILVVEEKRPVLETQLKDLLYNLPADRRPRVVGKRDEAGGNLLPSEDELGPGTVARAIAKRLGRFHASERMEERVARIDAMERRVERIEARVERTPYFCSGCPHNTSTRVPEGSEALAGIGCHYMALWMDRDTATFTQMGAEGANWLGLAPFSELGHVFVNIGDGTYFHSGLLAIRAAVAAGVNITYKILYNDAVAMTGGQPMDGPLGVPQITRQLAGEGVGRIAVVTDAPEGYARGAGLAPGVTLHHRDELDRVQRELRQWPGVSALVYDQTCATELRRRRKRGETHDPDMRVVINERVCEGCGDCSVQSNCLSVVPVETEYGRKRAIDQSACNKDYACLKGFCPSFVTVEGGRPRRPPTATAEDPAFAALPEPDPPAPEDPYGILVCGVGGTGVVTVGALLGMAAHLEGKGCSVLDITGLAQKFGAVYSHVRIADSPDALHAVRIAAGAADLVLGGDLVVAAGRESLSRIRRGRTRAVVNGFEAPTPEFTRDPDLRFPGGELKAALGEAAGAEGLDLVDATRTATALMGDTIAANIFLLGHAFQKGLVPLSAAAIERAIEINGVAAEANKRALRWGRLHAHDPGRIARLIERPAPEHRRLSESLDEMVERRARDLTDYQDAGYARRYAALVRRVRAAEADRAPGASGLAEAVARNYHKLLAYKDEYEVARLLSDRSFLDGIRRDFDGEPRRAFHLAPPLLAATDPATGRPKKRTYGPWVLPLFRTIARMRRLRGTAFDPFGRSRERRTERRLIAEYEQVVEELLSRLGHDNHALAVEIADLPDGIRGFGPVKQAHLGRVKRREAELLAAFRAPAPTATAAE